jgi:pimeloyl-ACP methyl ester carboxylesterase
MEIRQGVRGEDQVLGTLERLMAQVQTRHAGGGAAGRIDDWRTLQVTLTTSRPLPAQRLEAGRGVTLTDGVRIEPHPRLAAASARVASLPTATRAVSPLATLPRLLYDDPSIVKPFEFAATRAIGGGLNVLELSGVADPSVVTEQQPLTVVIPQPLAAHEHVLPVAFDGEFYLPLGRAVATGRETHVILERLPNPTEAETRSLGGALRILFQKVVARAFGTEYRYPILAAAEVGEDLAVRYEPDPDAVRARVANARRIALFVHGIIGDTREMAASLRRAGVVDRYDLVLTFDYENLQDPIGDTARTLKERLAAVGLGPYHSKSLDVIAHSMGGLVSRWFIEREGGNRVVRRLVMLGTPNGGSPWPRVQDWATTALAVGLNELSKVVWPASALAGLVQAVEAVDVTLDQMVPDSGFLKDLYSSPDPKIPYIMIAGNTSLISASAGDEERRSRLRRLLSKLWADQTKYDLADLFFGGSENDIAVSLASMRGLAEGREPTCEFRLAACDHLSYFRNPEGLRALAQAL